MSASEWIIAASALWVVFAYVGYPLGLLCLARISPRPVRRGDPRAPISIIIAVHDGASVLRRKLAGTCALRYPGEKEVIVASDASRDGSDEIARSFEPEGVRLVRLDVRGGKEKAQAAAIEKARGDVLVFTDVSAELEPDALVELLAPFEDPEVGCVSSEDLVALEEGDGSYVAYEMAIRRLESRVGSLVGASGSLFAARRELCHPWPTDLASDFRIALEACSRGLRAVSEPRARARIPPLRDAGREWARKVRTVRRGIAVLLAYRHLLRPDRGRVAFALWGHKLARFTSPFALVVLLVSSIVSMNDSAVWAAFTAVQIGAYGVGVAALALPALRRHAIPRLSGFLVLVNASMLVAWGYHLTGRKAVAWNPSGR